MTSTLDYVYYLTVNAANDLVRATWPDGSAVQWEYDADHRLTARTGPDGGRTVYDWGTDGVRVRSVTLADGSVRRYDTDRDTAVRWRPAPRRRARSAACLRKYWKGWQKATGNGCWLRT